MTEIEHDKEVEEYARKILAEHGCDEYTYGDESAEAVLKDLKEAYKDGMSFPYVEVANAIKRISKPHLIERKPFCVMFDTDSFCDGFECDSFEYAKDEAIETLIDWMVEEYSNWEDDDNHIPTEQEKENWDYMIYNCSVYVEKYNEDTDEYEDYWYPSDEELKEIGWVTIDERNQICT